MFTTRKSKMSIIDKPPLINTPIPNVSFSVHYWMATASKESLIKTSILKFLSKHDLEANVELIDDVILSYIISILEDLGDDTNAEENIDVDQFVEMMDAYISGFATIDSVKVVEWMFELASMLSVKVTDEDNNDSNETRITNGLTSLTLQEENKCNMNSSEEGEEENGNNDSGNSEECDKIVESLLEMFPTLCTMEIAHCLSLSNGDPEEAVQLILHRQETGDSIKPSPTKGSEAKEKTRNKYKQAAVLDEKDIKDKVLARYSYVDEKADEKTYIPKEPKQQPKKMIRYLDGKIVSTKGERYTELKKEDTEEMKKTYINLKPAKKYRFH
ncbi:hypothetical protein KUTeg_006746 [Tegillarca granosa]|uniref:CUE domain-containing protein n=1 Tax=Tegillarca granosa TaxID=220873 RepID=A0ABQ9FD85_TEGGR|nr:hypothetical protein KUTeg_006746 [Tegillarca granosa]